MNVKISTAQVQKTILAPSMQQSIEVLLLPSVELTTAIEQELQNNPMLEVDESKTPSEKEHMDMEELFANRLKNLEDSRSLPNYSFQNDDDLPEENMIVKMTPLEDYLLQQLRLELTDQDEVKIGELIIGNLDEDGYFRVSCEEIAQLLGLHSIAKIKSVLQTIQSFEPLGIASRNLRECLLTQVHYKYNGEGELISLVINNFLDELGRKNYQKIAARLKIPLEKVREVSSIIAKLEPKPARKYRPLNQNIYVKPDVSILQDADDSYYVQINKNDLPPLRVNPTYQKMLKQENRTEEEIIFIQEKIKNAINFIKSIEQRNDTLSAISGHILKHQKNFFENGHAHLKPMILKDVAGAIGRNESTVSRAISQKFMETPQGFYPMKYFFSQAVPGSNGENISNQSVKEEIKTLVEAENKDQPLSDQEIRLYLEQKNMKVARRTISKYRQTLNILPSNLRKV